MRARLILAALVALAGGPAPALELSMPGKAVLNAEIRANPDRYDLPLGPFSGGVLPVEKLEGNVLKQAWRIDQSGLTTLQIIRSVKDQLEAEGYEILLECGATDCGGFDFRFNTDVLPAPDMYVDLFDFRFLSARRPQADAVSVFVSRKAGIGYVQLVHVAPDGGSAGRKPAGVTAEDVAISGPPETVIDTLIAQGHVILDDLVFRTGSASLGPGPHGSLERLAEFLLADERRRIALVGHTDFVGSLTDNVKLSKSRADAVLLRLVEGYGVPRAQLDAEGVGYLSPLAPNSTREGREINRRVEAVLLESK
ncbi:OmpA family protein [Roseovarius sp. CAU 1744]|uniref:OmpA family protein n=1 Tax=Roseovarius sp. CAU 1744 TaxID=3140368 RepID=UPI00325A4648